MKLTGKCAVISGGAGHLGRAFGDTLGELGADIVLVDIDEARLELSAKELKAKSGKLYKHKHDLAPSYEEHTKSTYVGFSGDQNAAAVESDVSAMQM